MRAVLLLILLFALPAAQAAVRTWLDRQDVRVDETFTLNIEVDSAGASQPDLRALESDFEMLGSSSSSEMSLTNGKRTSRTLFAVALSPKREGVITIPAITVDGQSSDPILVTIKPSDVQSGPQGDVFVEAELSESNPFVQQQVIVTLRVFSVMQIQQGSLDLPIPDGIRAVRLGDDSSYRATRGSRQYVVIERRFALVPERSGQFDLGAAQFQGLGLGRGGINGYFGGASRLRAESESLALDVKPIPTGAASPWLPATALELKGEPELPAEIHVGEPISYPITLSAQGLSVDQLPELQLADSNGLSIYPDQPSSRDRSSLQGLAAERTRRFALVPAEAGDLVIPALTLRWWDVTTGQSRLAELPARTIHVLPAVGASPISPAALPTAAEINAGSEIRGGLFGNWPWMLLSLLLACGWVWTAWRGRKAQPAVRETRLLPKADQQSSAEALADLRRSLRDGDLSDIARAIRRCAPAAAAGNLSQLADLLSDAAQAAAIRELELSLYSGSKGDADRLRSELRNVFAKGPKWRSDRQSAAANDAPPPLYRTGLTGHTRS